MKSLITSSELCLTPWLVQDLMKRSLRLGAEGTFMAAFMTVWVTPSHKLQSSSQLDFPGGRESRDNRNKIPSGKSYQDRIYAFCRTAGSAFLTFSLNDQGCLPWFPQLLSSKRCVATSLRHNSDTVLQNSPASPLRLPVICWFYRFWSKFWLGLFSNDAN